MAFRHLRLRGHLDERVQLTVGEVGDQVEDAAKLGRRGLRYDGRASRARARRTPPLPGQCITKIARGDSP